LQADLHHRQIIPYGYFSDPPEIEEALKKFSIIAVLNRSAKKRDLNIFIR
jgi:hypothetical protein